MLGVFLFGAVIGSFLNVVILRSLSGESLQGRSHCPHCQHTLQWYDLVPIVSFILLRGRCRYCHNPISIQYPLVELAMGLGSVALFPNIAYIIVFALLLVLFVIDLRSFLLPDFFIIALSVVILLTGQVSYYGVLIGAGFMLLLWLVTAGRGIGFGDVKLLVPLGLLFGVTSTIILLAGAFIIVGAVGAYLLLTKQATLKTPIPFGPYLTGMAALLLIFPDCCFRVPLQI